MTILSLLVGVLLIFVLVLVVRMVGNMLKVPQDILQLIYIVLIILVLVWLLQGEPLRLR
jgi:hypothetical protein